MNRPAFPTYPDIPNTSTGTAFTQALLDWFEVNKRPLPWRTSYDPYAVWVSEIMLQQTQADRGTAFFLEWMKRFPDVRHVAEASTDDIFKAWEGLGYYARAKNLHAAAKAIMERHHGTIPATLEDLLALPGIGPYTAGAIASIAYQQPVPLVDANVERVFARIFDIDAPIKRTDVQKYLWQTAMQLLPSGAAREYNQALMELGALICKKTPLCHQCPVATHCYSHRLQITSERPLPGKKTTYTPLTIISGALVYKEKVFIQKRPDTGAWASLWEFPGGKLEDGETPAQGIVREYAEETEFAIDVASCLGVVHHAYTRYKIDMHCFLCHLQPAHGYLKDTEGYPVPQLHAATEYRWIFPVELDRYTFPCGHRKLIDTWMPQIIQATQN